MTAADETIQQRNQESCIQIHCACCKALLALHSHHSVATNLLHIRYSLRRHTLEPVCRTSLSNPWWGGGRGTSLASSCLLFPDIPVQAIVHTQKPVMRCIQLAHSGDGMLAHINEDSIPRSKALPVLAVKGAPHL